ncbi:MAG TPA: protoporphyrinogen oxidase [Kofleriaceae bacterium]|jgi:oxygen-dependent protoporphyrinogen oxidase|nr:protoporphyrinogen oxidase [Kofleriaceae bacterium]
MKIAVIGGGLGGLVAARALVRAGIDAQVLEAAPRAGGVIGTTAAEGYVREHAASSFLGGPPDGAYALCKDLGVALDKASPRARARWIYLDGKLRALPRSPIDLIATDLLTWRGKLDLLAEPFRPAGRTGEAGDESMHAFAARRFGAEAARAIVAPFVTGVYAADAHDISLPAGFPRIAALDARGGVVRGMLAQAVRGLGDRLRGVASVSTPRGMWAPVGGVGALTAALAGELGSRVRCGERVTQIEPADGCVAIDGSRWDGAVLAIPAEDAVGLVAGPRAASLGHRLAGFHRAPAAQVYLGFPAGAVPRAADGFGALVAIGEDVRVLGVVFESTVWPDRAPAGHVLLRCIYGGGRDPEATALDDAALIAQAVRDVAVVLGATGAPSHTSVVRWKRGVAQYTLGHQDRVRDAVAAARSQRIALAGADYRGPGLNDLCADGAAVVAEVRAW